IDLRVNPRSVVSEDAATELPEFLSEEYQDLRLPPFGTATLLMAVLVPPLGFVVWWLAWRRLHPDAARLARLHRSRAVRVALDELAALRPGPVFGDRLAVVVRTYLAGRAGLPSQASAPSEVEAWLAGHGAPRAVAKAARVLFDRIDAAR